MPLELYDRVKQKSTTAGTGNVTLTSSVATFLDFSGVYTDNDQLFYTIENLTDFEVGIGTYSGNTVSRDTVLKSSNSDSLLNLPGDSNTFVFVTYPASGAVHTSGNRCVVDIDGINFNVGAAPTYTEGRIFYDNENHALAVYNDEPDITLQVGQEEFLRVRNNTTGTIFNGEAVRISGSQGTHVTVAKAIATGDFVAQAIGLATHDIESNSFGYVTTYGTVRDLDTSDFNDGDEIFLSPEVSGGLTGVSPIAPNYKLSLGHVVRSHPTVGQIVVKPSTPKLGGGDVKTLGNKVPSGIAFTEQIAGTDAAIIASTTGLTYDSGNQVLQVNAGGVRFPDGATQTIAYTGQTDAYNYWELQVGSDIDTITSTERVQFTGEGLVSVAYDPVKNTVTISGAEGAATGLSDPIYIDLDNQLSGSGSFKYAGDTASIDATLTAAAISGQTATTTIADPDNFIIERGAALRKVARSVVVTGLATTGELDSVSGYLQGKITDNGVVIGFLQTQINTNESNISGVSGLLYNNWNINVTGNVDSITSNQTVVFTGLGLTTVTYDNATNIVSISGAGDGSGTGGSTTGVASGVAFFNRTSNEITGVSNFIYNQVLNQLGINADPQAGLHVKNDTSAYPVLTVEAGAGQALPLARFIDENGIVVATIDYSSGTFANSGGITYPDGNTQVVAYTGQTSETTGVPSGIAFFDSAGSVSSYTGLVYDTGNRFITMYDYGARFEVRDGAGQRTLVLGDNSTAGTTNVGYISFHVNDTEIGDIRANADGLMIRTQQGTRDLLIRNSNNTIIAKFAGGNQDYELFIEPHDSTKVAQIIQGAVSQTANLQEWHNASGNVLSAVKSDGTISGFRIEFESEAVPSSAEGMGIGAYFDGVAIFGADGNPQFYVIDSGSNNYAQHVQPLYFGGTFGAPDFVIQDEGLGGRMEVYKGNLTDFQGIKFGGNSIINNALSATTEVGLTIKGTLNQTANLQEWKNFSNDVVAEVSIDGNISGTATGIFDGGVTYPDGLTQKNAWPADVVESGTTVIALTCSLHANKYLRTTSASPTVIQVPSGLGCEPNTIISFEQAGAGSVNFSGAPGVTLNSFNSATGIEGQYGVVHLKQVATDTYTLYGDIA